MTISSTCHRFLGLTVPGLTLVAWSACTSEDRPPPFEPQADDSSSSNTSGGNGGGTATDGADTTSTGGTGVNGAGGSNGGSAANSANSTDGAAGAAGETNTGVGGSAGDGTTGGDADVCGDGSLGEDEACEPGLPLSASCADVGFETGVLSCNDDCTLNVSECSGTERCFDALDNDGDELVDCMDSDCAVECADSCSAPPEIASGDSVEGTTVARPSELVAGCSADSGREMVYQVTADITGKLQVELEATGGLTASIRTQCDSDATELACRVAQGVTRISADVSEGELVFVVIDGFEADTASDFTLHVQTRLANQCGDGFVDEAEQCDDDNLTGGDGCDASCNVESKEDEPNDTQETATPFDHPQYAAIDPAGDVDYYSLQVLDGPRLVTINTYNLGAGYCSQLLMDPMLELFSSGGQLLASDDDGGDGYCARISTMLDTGSYYVVVRESDDAGEDVLPTFPYRLGVTIQ